VPRGSLVKAQPTADQLARHPLEYWEAVEYFNANRKKIAKKHEDQFVAILDSKVVDSDKDYGDLSARVEGSLPDRHPYLGYSNAKSLDEIFAGFETRGEVDWERLREEAEADAADEFIRRMHENMK
jgi:uncharacterized protein DUF5678